MHGSFSISHDRYNIKKVPATGFKIDCCKIKYPWWSANKKYKRSTHKYPWVYCTKGAVCQFLQAPSFLLLATFCKVRIESNQSFVCVSKMMVPDTHQQKIEKFVSHKRWGSGESRVGLPSCFEIVWKSRERRLAWDFCCVAGVWTLHQHQVRLCLLEYSQPAQMWSSRGRGMVKLDNWQHPNIKNWSQALGHLLHRYFSSKYCQICY